MKLKSFLTIGVFLVAYIFTYAQVANDDPCNAAEIPVGNSCSYMSFTNENATATAGLTSPTCGNYLGGDVWFKFTMPLNGQDVVIDLADNGGIENAAIAVYTGPNCSSLTELICDDNSGPGLMPTVTMDDGCSNANGGVTYWVRVWEFENNVAGTFDICTYKADPPAPILGCGAFLPPANTCCDALNRSLCEIDGYCSSSANAYTVTPTENVPFCAVIENNGWISFVASSEEVELEFVVENCGMDFGIQAQIFETDDCQNFTIVSTCFNPGPGASLSGFLRATTLVPGNTYYLMVDGWANDQCDYTIYVADSPPEVEVSTMPATICDGSSTQLFAEVFGVGDYTYSWSPSGNLSDPTIANPIASPTATTRYTVDIGGLCNAISTYDLVVTVDPGPSSNVMVTGQTILCDDDLSQSYSATGDNMIATQWTVSGGIIIGPDDGTTVDIDWSSAGGTICFDASNGCGAAPQECLIVSVSPKPSISMASPITGCADPGVDMTSITINDASNSVGIVTFYPNAGAANAGSPELPSSLVTTSGIYYVRKESAPNCFDVASVAIVLEEPDISITDPAPVCKPDQVDLNSAFVSDANGLSGTNEYFSTEADAQGLTNELASSIVSVSGVYWVRFTTNSGCFDIAPINATIDETPDLSANQTGFCEGTGIDLATIPYFDANSTAISTERYYDNFTLAITGSPGFALSNTTVQDTGFYYLYAATAAGCSDVVQLHVVFDETIEGSISGDDDLCAGDNIELLFNITGTPPFDVVYSDGNSDFNLTGINDGHIETIAATATTTYTLKSISNGTCPAIITNDIVNINVTNSANANISGSTSACFGTTSDITFNVDAFGLFDLVISDGTTTETLPNVSDGFVHTVAPAVTTTYTIVDVIDNNFPSCGVNFSGGVTIDVNTATDTSAVQIVCNPNRTQYQVIIDIIGGDPSSYMVNGDAGTITGSQFTSAFINSTAPYSFELTDANNCNPITIAGSHECPCISDAGLMLAAGGEYCPGDLILITHNNSEVLDGNDAFGFILHDNAGTTVGNVVATNTSGTFTYDPATMTYGTQYYSSSVVANDDGSGFPVLDISSDPCLSVSAGTPITFLRPSEATLSGTQSLCPGELASIVLTYDAPIAIDIVVSDGTTTQTVTGISNGETFDVTPTATTTYTIMSAMTTDPIYCDIDVSGSTMVTLSQLIDTTAVQFVCNATMTEYQVVIDIAGGDPSSYMVNGDAGTIAGSQFTSAFISSLAPYSFEVTDANNCNPITIVGSYECPCISDAGLMLAAGGEYCPGDLILITHNNSEVLDGDDAFGFILHDNAGTTIGNVVATNTSGTFTFDPATMTYGTQYYSSSVVANDDGSGFPVLNLSSDPCLSVSAGTPITFLRPSEATLSGTQSLCPGESASIVLTYDAPIAIDIVVSDGTTTQTVTGISNGETFDVTPTATTTYTIMSAMTTDPIYCDIDVSGSTMVTLNQLIDTTAVQFVCNNTGTQYQVVIDITGGDPSSYMVNGDAGMMAGAQFTSAFIDSTVPYSFEVTDANNCNPISIAGSYECPCISDAGLMLAAGGEYCPGDLILITHNNSEVLDGNDAFGFILHDNAGTTVGNVVATNTSGTFTFDPATMTYGTQYYSSSVAANDDGSGFPVLDIASDPCLSVSAGTPITFLRPSEATLSGTQSLCPGESVSIVLTYDAPIAIDIVVSDGTTTQTVTGISNGETFDVTPTATTTYTIMSAMTTDPIYCDIDVSGSAMVTLNQLIDTTAVQFTCNATGTQYQVVIDIAGGDPSSYMVNGDAGTISGNQFASDFIDSGVAYSFEVTDANNCNPISITGNHECPCISDAGAVTSTGGEFCPGDVITLTHDNLEVLDGDDAFGYILHDNAGATVGNVVASNATGEFTFDPSTMNYGTQYYSSAVVANDNGSGMPVLDITIDPCLSVAAGMPVTFLRPSEAILSGDQLLCPGEIATLTLTYDAPIAIDIVISDGTTTETITGLSNGDTFEFTPTATTTYTIMSAMTTDPIYCDIEVSGNAAVTLSSAIDISTEDYTCNTIGTEYQVVFDITGGDPSTYVVNGDAGTISGSQFTSAPIASNTDFSFEITDANNCEPIILAGSFICGCTTDAGEMVSAGGEFCPGDLILITHNNAQVLDGNDVFGYILHDEPGTTVGNVVASNNSGAFAFDASTMTYGVQYYISPVAANDDGSGMPVLDIASDPCLSVGAGTPVVYKRDSEVVLSGGATLCPGETATLTLSYDAPINIDVVISDGTDFETLTNVGDGHTFEVSVSGMKTYTIESATTTDPAFCEIEVAGTAIVTSNNAPDTTGVQIICSTVGTQYQVIFDITGGDASSYVVNGDAGNLVGSQFTSAFINSGTPYSFMISDINGCPPVNLAGTFVCNCSSYAGIVDIAAAEYCGNETTVINHDNGEILDANDAFGYVMHDSETTTLGNVVATNFTGAFTFDSSTMTYGTTYYISAAVGDDDGSGSPMLDISIDPCLSVSLGTPVTFLRGSEATLSGGGTFCAGDPAILTVSYDAPIDIDIVIFNGTDFTTIPNVSDGYQFEVTPSEPTTYTLSEATTNDGTYCTIDVSGTAVVTTTARAIADNVQVNCDGTNTQFQVIFNIVGGAAGSYTVTGDPGTLDLATSTFTSEWYPSGSAYAFAIEDAQGCPPFELTGSNSCNCSSSAGTVGSSDEIVCAGMPYLIYYNDDGTLDGDDVLGFVLHDGTATTLGTPLMTNLNGVFNYDDPLVFGQTYFVMAVVGTDDGTGFPVLDASMDPCLSFSNGLPVTFQPSVTAGISAPDSICSNEPIPVTFHFDGTGLYNVEFFDGTSIIILENLLNGYVQSFDYTSDVQFYLQSVSAADCEGILDPAATTVNVEVFPTAEVVNVEVMCMSDTAYVISFEITGGDESSLFVSGDAGTLTGRTFVSDPITNNTPYSFVVDDASICAPIDVVGIQNCMCDPNMTPFINVNNQLTCTNQVNGIIEVVHPNDGGVAPYSYEWSSGAIDKSLKDLGPGVYYVTISDANGCSVIDSIEFTAPDPIFAEAIPVMPTCPGEEDGSISFQNVTGGSGNYEVQLDGGFGLSEMEHIGFPSGTFNAIITDDIGCSWEQEIVIDEPEDLLLDLGIDTLISRGDSVRLLPLTNGFIDTFMWSQDQLLSCPSCFSQVVYPLESTVYELTIVDPNGCVTTDDVVIRVDDERPVYIPNVFHPDGDGKNDRFMVFGGHVVEEIVSMRIYDRWGEQLHFSEGYAPNDESKGWDGTFRGTMMNPGVYIYAVEIRFSDGPVELFKGDVTLIR